MIGPVTTIDDADRFCMNNIIYWKMRAMCMKTNNDHQLANYAQLYSVNISG